MCQSRLKLFVVSDDRTAGNRQPGFDKGTISRDREHWKLLHKVNGGKTYFGKQRRTPVAISANGYARQAPYCSKVSSIDILSVIKQSIVNLLS
jgi:hypothetical protein